MTNEVVRQSERCSKCGGFFELRYSRRTGEAVQTWPTKCGPESDCFKRMMPKSDFVKVPKK